MATTSERGTDADRTADRDALSAAASVLCHKWDPLIVRELLARGPCRFSELGRLDGLSNKVLSESLDHLESAGLVDREVVSEKPVRVRYSLTESGRALDSAIDALEQWGRVHG
jgi:DNA-binding HxlR family transcriptional regulator